SLDAYEGLLGVGSCIGAKHSSLSRAAEWDRLALRDRVRPEFHVFTGNDLAIDMVCYGSDYLLGLSAFAPAAFAERDRRWANGEVKRLRTIGELRDRLTLLGIAEQLGIDDAVDPDGPLASTFSFTDGSAGTFVVRNRFAVLPMEGWDGEADGRPTDLVHRRW